MTVSAITIVLSRAPPACPGCLAARTEFLRAGIGFRHEPVEQIVGSGRRVPSRTAN